MEIQLDPQTQAELRDLAKRYPNIAEIQRRYGEGLINTPAGQRGNFFSLDPGGALGVRQRTIEELSGRYEAGRGFTDTAGMGLLGITEQDLANQRLTQYNAERAAIDPRYQYGEINFPEGQTPNAATTNVNLAKNVTRVATEKNLLNEITKVQNGAALLRSETKRLGRTPNNSELQEILTIAKANTPEAKQGRELVDANIDSVKQGTAASKQSVEASKSTVRVNEGNLALNQTIARNNKALQEYEIAERAAERQFRDAESARQFAFQAEEGNRNRGLQLQLANMSREERQDDRRYSERREERDRRQLMILQLIKGLQQAGQAFSF